MNLLRGFYICVLITSLLNINNNLNNLSNPSILISIIGITSSIAFFSKRMRFSFLGIIWIVAQVPYMIFGDFTFDLSQFINAHFAVNLGSISVGINAQVLLLFFLIPISLSEFLYRKVIFNAYTENSELKREDTYSFTPNGIEYNRLTSDSKIVIENKTYNKIIFEPQKSEGIKKAGIVLISETDNHKIKATIEYKTE
ncbi:membrane hypothetical protein [Tenacibaculum sediminilitoris]|uniref:hypothetical protein n=1 Tax=Tenacibaculum sediminilitoris TaxID=1820334 RepID=UPI0038946EDE